MNYQAEEIVDVPDNKIALIWPYADGTHAMPSPNGGTILPAIPAVGGYVILGNIGQKTTYTSADGSVVIQFGAWYDGTQWQLATPSNGSFTVGGVLYYFSGPYVAIDPTVIDMEDAGFTDVTEVDEINPFPDVYTGEYPTRPRSGHLRTHGAHYADKSQALRHQHGSHHARGHFAGASLSLQSSTTSGWPSLALYIVPNGGTTSEPMLWQTDDGSGDSTNGTPAGCFLIEPPNTYASTHTPKWRPVTGTQGANGFGFGFTVPAPATPGNCLITLSAVFPPSFTSHSGDTPGSGTPYQFRYCYYTTISGQTVESALSPVYGPFNCPGTITLGIPAVPSGWNGVHVYVDGGLGAGDIPRFLCGTSSVTTAQTLTVPPSGTTNTIASRGFTIWPQGTNIVTTTGNQFLVKVGHTSGQPDNASFNYTVTSHLGGATGTTRTQIAPGPVSSTLITNASGEVVWSTASGLPVGVEGDLLYYHSGSWQALTFSPGALLASNATDPGWVSTSAVGSIVYSQGSGSFPAWISGTANGGLLYGLSGVAPAWTGPGTTGQLLQSNGNGNVPTYVSHIALADSTATVIQGTGTGHVGVQGISDTLAGVLGSTTSGQAGVYGDGGGGSSDGVYGTSGGTGAGVYGISAAGYGVYAKTTSGNAALYAETPGNGEAVYGYATANGVGIAALAAGISNAMTAQNTGTGPIFTCFDSAGAAVFKVDQSGVTVGLITPDELVNGSYSLLVDSAGHLVSVSGTPTAGAGAGLGTGGSFLINTGSTDVRMGLSISLGTAPSGTPSVTVNFANAYGNTNYRVAATILGGATVGVQTRTTSSVTLQLNNVAASTTYSVDLLIIG